LGSACSAAVIAAACEAGRIWPVGGAAATFELGCADAAPASASRPKAAKKNEKTDFRVKKGTFSADFLEFQAL